MTRKALTAWALTDLGELAALVVSELVTNTVDHARGTHVRVTVALVAVRRVRFTVTDREFTRPTLRFPCPGDLRGRGLVLIDALAANWGVDELEWGKRVWVELEVEQPVVHCDEAPDFAQSDEPVIPSVTSGEKASRNDTSLFFAGPYLPVQPRREQVAVLDGAPLPIWGTSACGPCREREGLRAAPRAPETRRAVRAW